MFYCQSEEPHLTKPGETRYLVTVKEREVEYTHIITNSKKETNTVYGKGKEIAKEQPMCEKHMMEPWRAWVVTKVNREQKRFIPEYKRITDE